MEAAPDNHDDLIGRIDETNKRMDRLYEVIVRRDEHVGLEHRVRELDRNPCCQAAGKEVMR